MIKKQVKRFLVSIRNLILHSPINGLIVDRQNVYVLSYPKLTNIGDEVQSIASRDLLSKLGFGVKYVQRERLSKFFSFYRRKAVLNGWFSHDENSFPPTKAIIPIFIGFHLANKRILNSEKAVNYFKKHGPIGCRDFATQTTLTSVGVEAYYSGCPTLTLNKRDTKKTIECLVVDAHLNNPDGHTSDARHLLNSIIDKYNIKNIQYATQNCEENTAATRKVELAEARLNDLCASKLVITNRIHVALPCLAMQVPVIFIHAEPEKDARIASFLDLFWYKTNAEEVLPSEIDYLKIKNKDTYLKLRDSILTQYKTHLN
jgi:hypothetical protein